MRRTASLCMVAVALPWAAAQSTTPASFPPSSPSSSPALASATPIPVIGVRTGIDKVTGKPPARLNINGLWAKGGAQWHLYILALSELQALNETNELSYFAVAGIHGYPHSAWNGVGHVDGAPSNRGFCPHGELLFQTWHRPYVALFEQILVARAVDIASRYPPDLLPEYMAAAESLRQPYWDWAMNPALPVAATRLNMTVQAPEGRRVIPNPLYTYKFQRLKVEEGFGDSALTHYPQTIRCSRSGGVLNDANESNEGLLLAARDLTGSVYDVFTRVNTYDGMSSSSFENAHNLIHLRAGCNNGTMADINWSAFEPLFMLHHCNVDRLVAMWQTIYYNNSMFTSSALSGGQFGTPANTVITADSPLKPFFRAPSAATTNGNSTLLEFHTSNTVANVSVFGYTYPELPDWSLPAETRAEQVRAKVNALYGDMAGDDGATTLETGPLNRMGKGTTRDYWVVEMSVERGELAGRLPATVSLFIRGESIGRMTLLGMPCEGVARESVPVQDIRVGNGTLKDLDRESVVGYLKREVGVGIKGADGEEVSVGNVPSLGVVVLDMEYAPRTNLSSFPVFNGKVTRWPVEMRQDLGVNETRSLRRGVVRWK